jgi:hypothetical protein
MLATLRCCLLKTFLIKPQERFLRFPEAMPVSKCRMARRRKTSFLTERCHFRFQLHGLWKAAGQSWLHVKYNKSKSSFQQRNGRERRPFGPSLEGRLELECI